MSNVPHTMTLIGAERRELKRLITDRKTAEKVVWRAPIVLAIARGLSTGAIAKENGKDKASIWRWQQRFGDESVEGLTRDKTRPPGRKPLADDLKANVLTKTVT
jgi:transposase